MIYLFTGNSSYLVREQTLAWKNAFISKHGDFNLMHFKNLLDIDNNILIDSLTAESFFSEKKLIIIDDFPISGKITDKNLRDKQDFLESILCKILDNNIVLFSSINPDKRSKFYKALVNIAEIKEFNTKSDNDISFFLNNKYSGKISNKAVDLLIKYKAGNLEKIISEIEKLLITNNIIDDKMIFDNVMPELEESIFLLIDDILNLNINNAINKLNIILDQTVVYAFYNNLLANIRVHVFIEKFKKNNVKNISDLLKLGNRTFLINKRTKISFQKLQNFYIGLVDLDKKMKSGKMIGSEEDVLKYEIEKQLLKIL